jgi:hypothetical protein
MFQVPVTNEFFFGKVFSHIRTSQVHLSGTSGGVVLKTLNVDLQQIT